MTTPPVIQIITTFHTVPHFVEVAGPTTVDTIQSAGFEHVPWDGFSSAVEPPKCNTGTRLMGLWQPSFLPSTSEKIAAMISSMIYVDPATGKTYKGRPATTQELAAYEKAHKADHLPELGDHIIVALGEMLKLQSDYYVTIAQFVLKKRGLYLKWWSGKEWFGDDLFLVVFEEVNKSVQC